MHAEHAVVVESHPAIGGSEGRVAAACLDESAVVHQHRLGRAAAKGDLRVVEHGERPAVGQPAVVAGVEIAQPVPSARPRARDETARPQRLGVSPAQVETGRRRQDERHAEAATGPIEDAVRGDVDGSGTDRPAGQVQSIDEHA